MCVMKHISVILLLSLLLSLSAVMQAVGGPLRLTGTVVDSLTSEPVPYATVLIYRHPATDVVVRSLLTGDDGGFATDLPSAGDYRLTVSLVGKERLVRDFHAARAVNLGVLRLVDDVEMIDEVAVIAKKPLIKVETDKIVYDVASDADAGNKTASEMLRKVPMVSVDGDGNVKLAGSSNFKVYVNGRPNSMMSNNAKDVLKAMPASSIKKVEVITNPGAKYDAEGVGGIINIVTSGASFEGYNVNLSGAYTENNGWLATAYGAVKVGRFSLSANYANASVNSLPVDAEYLLDYQEGSPVARAHTVYDGCDVGNKFSYATLEASFELDSLNLFSLSGNYFDFVSEISANGWSEARDWSDVMAYRYGLGTMSKMRFGAGNLSLDYQHLSPRREGETFVFSYRLDNTPNDADNEMRVFDTENFEPYEQWQKSDGRSMENTFQADYTLPLDTNHTLNFGAKYIYRLNDSRNLEHRRRDASEEWSDVTDIVGSGDNYHRQHVLGIYGQYDFNYKRFGLQLGLRYEYTRQNVSFKKFRERDFDASFSDLVPSFLLSFNITAEQTLSLGYNMRISRPGIYYLNPFHNSGQTPLGVSYGNPELDTERYNVFALSYYYFTSDFTVGAELRYTYTNNAITDYNFVDESGVVNSTYENIGVNHTPHLSVFSNWNATSGTRINLNLGLGYSWLRTNSVAEKQGIDSWRNKGLDYHAIATCEQNLPWKLLLNVYASVNRGNLQLYSLERILYYGYGLSLSRGFLKNERLRLSISAQNFAPRRIVQEGVTRASDYTQHVIQRFSNMAYSISLSYSFGDLKTKVQKATKSIENTDVVGGRRK